MNRKSTKTPTKHDKSRSSSTSHPSRSKTITNSGYLFIATNFFLGLFNAIVGVLAGSLAITSDAIHSFIDSISGFFIIISEKLANHHKLSNYRANIERLTTVIIAIIIIITGIDIMVESVQKILEPESPDYSPPIIIVLIASIAMKYLLARFLKKKGASEHSTVLTASGVETMNDTWISIAVLISAIFYLITHIDIEAYVSIVIALLIIKVGLEFIFPHLSHHHHHALESNPDHDHCGKV